MSYLIEAYNVLQSKLSDNNVETKRKQKQKLTSNFLNTQGYKKIAIHDMEPNKHGAKETQCPICLAYRWKWFVVPEEGKWAHIPKQLQS
jgi:hypothetical protein